MRKPAALSQWVFSPWQQRQGLPAIIEQLLRYPIHNKRWKSLKRQLRTALENHATAEGVSPAEAIQLIATNAIWLVTHERKKRSLPTVALTGHDVVLDSWQAWCRALRRQVNEEATQDLLGKDWRQPHARPVTAHEECKAFLAIEFALRSRRLTPQERVVIRTLVASEGDGPEAARRLGCSATAMWKRLDRIRQKLA